MLYDKDTVLSLCKKMSKNTLMEALQIEFIDAGEDFLKAQMPVTPTVHQPMGLLHGGASVALAESVGSAASIFFVDHEKFEVRGIEISANHVKAKRDGMVYGTARIVHQGKSVHLWEIKITDENDNLISVCKMSNMVIPKRPR